MKQWEYSLSNGIRKEQSSDFGSKHEAVRHRSVTFPNLHSLFWTRRVAGAYPHYCWGEGGTHRTGCQPIVEIYMSSINAASLMVNVDQLIASC